MTKGICCDTELETMTHCQNCGNLLVALTDIVDKDISKLPLESSEESQRHFIRSKLEVHIGKCDQCSSLRFFHDVLKDDD